MAFTETWLTDVDSNLNISCFRAPLWLDRDSEVAKKSLGGVCIHVNMPYMLSRSCVEHNVGLMDLPLN